LWKLNPNLPQRRWAAEAVAVGIVVEGVAVGIVAEGVAVGIVAEGVAVEAVVAAMQQDLVER
tara:strand:- start:295 stop:480 length:186 start_codon:yes stop_codon:yes gene_type:complete